MVTHFFRPVQALPRARSAPAWPLALLTGAGVLVALSGALELHVNLSRSVPRGLYRGVTEPAARGTLVAACLPLAAARLAHERGYLGPGACPGRVEPALKVTGAAGGYLVELGPTAVTVNGTPLPSSRTAEIDSRHRALSHAPWGRHRVAADEVWLFNTGISEGWDSRYFGPVRRADIRATARAIVTVD